MSAELVIQRRGQSFPGEVLKGFQSEEAAMRFAAEVQNLPVGTIHYVIIREDGRTVWDTRKQDLIPN